MNDSQDIVLYPPEKKHPAVIVNDTGIIYTPSTWPIFTINTAISWSQIAAILPKELSRQERGRRVTHSYLAIVPKDVLSFLDSYPFFKRIVLAGAVQRLGTPMAIFATFLPISVADLLTRIRAQYPDKIERYDIKIGEGE